MTPDAERSCRFYPEDVEAWWVERAKRSGRTDVLETALARVAPAAAAVSDRFTVDRPERFDDYHDAETLLAYGVFFFPQSWCRVRFALAEAADLRGWVVPTDRPVRVLDLGAGTGAAGLSAARWLLARGAASVHLEAVDHSPSALAALRDLARATSASRGEIRLSTRVGDLLAPPPSAAEHDVVLLSFAVNEAFAERTDEEAVASLGGLAARLAPNGILVVVEPALRVTSLRLRRLVAAVLEGSALYALGPQLAPEPWRPREDGRFWPHEVRRWRCPKSVAIVNRTLRRSLAELAFSFATLGRAAPRAIEGGARVFRLTSPVASSKGRLVWTGLGADGAERAYEGLTRSISAEDLARVERFERGDVVESDAVAPVGEAGALRIGSIAALRVRFHPD